MFLEGQQMIYDLHTHTTFSDGSEMTAMVAAAEAAGYDGIGLTDHCILIEDAFGRRDSYDLVTTYETRREKIQQLREDRSLRIFDAVELSYVPDTNKQISSFLDQAGFEYTIGAVHFADVYDYTSSAPYADCSEEKRLAAVDTYYETLVELIESELFDIVAHLDLPERHSLLRGHTTASHYEMVADAIVDSRTVPEINAGRVFRSLGTCHPAPDQFSIFADRGIEFVLGSDSHTPAELTKRSSYLSELLETQPAPIIALPETLTESSKTPQ